MGAYVYTMRKRARKVNGVAVRFFSYAYKPSYAFTTRDMLERSIRRYEAAAEAAFEDYDGGPVMLADHDKDLNGAPVYRNVRSAIWNDMSPFPGQVIGFIKQEGRKLTLVPEYRWRAQQPNDRTFVEYIKDGHIAQRVEMD